MDVIVVDYVVGVCGDVGYFEVLVWIGYDFFLKKCLS